MGVVRCSLSSCMVHWIPDKGIQKRFDLNTREIHPSTHFLTTWSKSGLRCRADQPRRPSPQWLPPAHPGGALDYPRTSWEMSSQQRFLGQPQGLLPTGIIPKGGHPGGIFIRCPNQLNRLSMWRSRGSTLRSSWMAELLIRSERVSPAPPLRLKPQIGHLYWWSKNYYCYWQCRALSHEPQLLTIGESWKEEGQVCFEGEAEPKCKKHFYKFNDTEEVDRFSVNVDSRFCSASLDKDIWWGEQSNMQHLYCSEVPKRRKEN